MLTKAFCHTSAAHAPLRLQDCRSARAKLLQEYGIRASAAGSSMNEYGKLGHGLIPEVCLTANLTCANGGCRVSAALVCLAWPRRSRRDGSQRNGGLAVWLLLRLFASASVDLGPPRGNETKKHTRWTGRNPLEGWVGASIPHGGEMLQRKRPPQTLNCERMPTPVKLAQIGQAGGMRPCLPAEDSRPVSCGVRWVRRTMCT